MQVVCMHVCVCVNGGNYFPSMEPGTQRVAFPVWRIGWGFFSPFLCTLLISPLPPFPQHEEKDSQCLAPCLERAFSLFAQGQWREWVEKVTTHHLRGVCLVAKVTAQVAVPGRWGCDREQYTLGCWRKDLPLSMWHATYSNWSLIEASYKNVLHCSSICNWLAILVVG